MQNNKNEFPWWLVCLLLFGVLLSVSLILIPRRLMLRNASSAAAGSGNIVTSQYVMPTASPAPSESVSRGQLTDTSPSVTSLPVAEDATGSVAEDIVSPALPAEEGGHAPQESDDGNAVVMILETPEPTPEPMHVHTYRDGVCVGCGKAVEFYTELLPEELLQKSDRPGTVETWNYRCTAYANHGYGEYDKTCSIYLPFGYDTGKQYNVLVLLPPSGESHAFWLTEEHEYGETSLSGRTILDRMFELGYCEPCIVVCPVAEDGNVQGLTGGIYQMRDELRNDILPYIAGHYSTYARDGKLDSLRAARDHFGLGGASNGSLFTFEGGMRYNFDLFGSYIALSGDGEPWLTVSIIQEDGYADLPVNCLFTGAGTHNDWALEYTTNGYRYFIERDARFQEGRNTWNVDVEGSHEWKVWLTDLANGLQVAF